MKETRKQKDMFVKIPDNFTEQGLTLEHAYIYWRVARFNDGGLPYYESNKTLAEIMGKSESTVKRYIDELVKEGHLYRKTRARKRLLSIKPFNYEGQNEPLLEVQNEPYETDKSIGKSSMRVKMNSNIGQNEPYETDKSIGKSSMRVKMNSNIGQNEPHEGFKMNHYKNNRIDKLIEENPNPKNRSTNLNDLPLDKQVELLEEALENINYRDD